MNNRDFNSENKEPKKKRNIKHGILAISAIIITIILIFLGIYTFEQFTSSKENMDSPNVNTQILNEQNR